MINQVQTNDPHQRMAGEEYPCQHANYRHSAAWLGCAASFRNRIETANVANRSPRLTCLAFSMRSKYAALVVE